MAEKVALAASEKGYPNMLEKVRLARLKFYPIIPVKELNEAG